MSSALFPRLPFHPAINLPPRSIGEAVLEAVSEASAARKEPISTTLANEGFAASLSESDRAILEFTAYDFSMARIAGPTDPLSHPPQTAETAAAPPAGST